MIHVWGTDARASHLSPSHPRTDLAVLLFAWSAWLDRRSTSVYAADMLLFKKKFLDDIRSGRKTQTIRLWKYRRMKTGQRSYIPGVGYIRVTLVEKVELSELTDEDAIPDGFQTADALRAEIDTLYADKLAEGYQAYRIVFHLLPGEKKV